MRFYHVKNVVLFRALYLRKAIRLITMTTIPTMLLILTLNANALDLTLAWDANSEARLAGYKLYYGTQHNDYETAIDVGNVTQYEITGLAADTIYYFAVTAYDNEDPANESNYSRVLKYYPDLTKRAIFHFHQGSGLLTNFGASAGKVIIWVIVQ